MKWFFSIIICTLFYTASPAQTTPVAPIAIGGTLDFYLQLAKNNSPLLKDIRNQIASNSVDSLRLLAGYKTQVNATSGGLYAPVIGGYGYAEPITNEHTLNALVGVNKAIVTKKNYINPSYYAPDFYEDCCPDKYRSLFLSITKIIVMFTMVNIINIIKLLFFFVKNIIFFNDI